VSSLIGQFHHSIQAYLIYVRHRSPAGFPLSAGGRAVERADAFRTVDKAREFRIEFVMAITAAGILKVLFLCDISWSNWSRVKYISTCKFSAGEETSAGFKRGL